MKTIAVCIFLLLANQANAEERLVAVSGQMEEVSKNSFIGITNAARGAWSHGKFEFNQETISPLFISTDIERITSDTDRPIEIYFLGGAFAVANGKYFFYESEEHWTGWQAIPYSVSRNVNNISVFQDGNAVTAFLNGYKLSTFQLKREPTKGKVSLFFKGNPGYESKAKFSNYSFLFNKPAISAFKVAIKKSESAEKAQAEAERKRARQEAEANARACERLYVGKLVYVSAESCFFGCVSTSFQAQITGISTKYGVATARITERKDAWSEYYGRSYERQCSDF